MGNCTNTRKSTYNMKYVPQKIPQKKRQFLTIGTLNYSSILKSPFEFFSADFYDEELGLSRKFKQIAQNYSIIKLQETEKWPLGAIDKKLQNRYSPLYDKKCGISTDYLLQNSNQFSETWVEIYQDIVQQLSIHNVNWNQQQIETALVFDLICYHSIIAFIFDLQEVTPKQIDKFIDTELTVKETKIYQNFLQKFFKKSFLNEDIKILKTLQAMRKFDLDIMFLQESDKLILSAIESRYSNIRIAQSPNENCDSAILINQRAFPGLLHLSYENRVLLENQTRVHKKSDRNVYSQITINQLRQLNINNKTIIQVVGNFIVISTHLTSKKYSDNGSQTNQQQVQKLIKTLNRLKNVFAEYEIICGVDANAYICSEQIPGFYIYPELQQQYTTNKTRTYLQPQINKAENFQKGRQARDFIISTTMLFKEQILTIEGKHYSEVSNLPCNNHPYDHYFVKADIQRIRKIRISQKQQNNIKEQVSILAEDEQDSY